jgi:hypothetical protein
MKKLLIFLFVLVSFRGFSQYPIQQNIGAGTTLVRVPPNGGFQASLINRVFPDTILANLTPIKTYPGAQIVTFKLPVDSGTFWYRNGEATKWLRGSGGFGSGGITNIYLINGDSCVVVGIDTLCVNYVICGTDVLSDTTILICPCADSLNLEPICDTLAITPGQNFMLGQNWVTVRRPGIWEFGGNLSHETVANTRTFTNTFTGYPYGRFPIKFEQQQNYLGSPGIVSFRNTNTNTKPSLSINFSDSLNACCGVNYPDTAFYSMLGRGNRGYYITTNNSGYGGIAQTSGIPTQWLNGDTTAKWSGIFFHDLDVNNDDGVTIFAAPPAPIINSFKPHVVAEFKNTKDIQFPGYPNTRNDGVSPFGKGFFSDSLGNLKFGVITNGGITIFNDTTIIICSFGNSLCDTFYVTNITKINNVRILNDSTLEVCDTSFVPICDTLHIPRLINPGFTADNMVQLSTPTNVQLGATNDTGSPALHNTYLNTDVYDLTVSGTKPTGVLIANNTADGIAFRGIGEIKLDSFPSPRSDGVTSTVLYTDASGNLQHGQILTNNPLLGTFRIDGGQIVWLVNLDYRVSASNYVINGTQYHSNQDTITLAVGDDNFDRIDLVVTDTAGNVVVIEGDPSINPQQPSYNPASQLPLGFILVTAGSTTPACVSIDSVYRNNAGHPNEWAASSSGASINVNSTNNPQSAPRDIEGTAAAVNTVVTLTAPTPLNIDNITQLNMYIRSKGSWGNVNNGKRLIVTLHNAGGTQVGISVLIMPSGTFGFNSATTGVYQQVSIPKANFQVPSATSVASIKLTVAGSQGTMGFYLDDITLARDCIIPPPDPTSTGKIYATVTVGASNAKNINPALYDFMCSGTDDHVIINNAIASLPAAGGKVLLSEGTFNTGLPIILNKENVTLEGNGTNTKIRLANAKDVNVIELGNGSGTKTGMKIKNLTVDGNMANQTVNVAGIYLNTDADYATIENCIIKSAKQDNIFVETGCTNVTIRNNVIDSNGSAGGGTNIQTNGARTTIDGNKCSNSLNTGIYLGFNAINSIVSNNIVEKASVIFIESRAVSTTVNNNTIHIAANLTPDYGIAITDNSIVSNNIINVGAIGVQIGDGNGVIQTYGNNNSIIGNSIFFANTTYAHWGIVTENTQFETRDIVTGNTIVNLSGTPDHAEATAIQLSGAGNTCNSNQITGFAKGISDYQSESLSHSTITANTFTNVNYPIIFLAECTNINISDNIITNCIIGISDTSNMLSSHLIITGNNIDSSKNEAIILRSTQNSVVSNNVITNAGASANNTYAAILLTTVSGTNYSKNNVISGNTINSTISNKHKYGIRENSANDGANVITNNNVLGAATANISTQNTRSDVSHNITGTTGIERHYPVTTKGDLMVGNEDGNIIRVGVGTDGHVLTADAAFDGGVKWAAGGSAGDSVNIYNSDGITTNLDSAQYRRVFNKPHTGIAFVDTSYTGLEKVGNSAPLSSVEIVGQTQGNSRSSLVVKELLPKAGGATWSIPARFIAPNLSSGHSSFIGFGKTPASTGNEALMGLNWIGSNNDTNAITFDFYGVGNNLLRMYRGGVVNIGTATYDPTHKLTVNGKGKFSGLNVTDYAAGEATDSIVTWDAASKNYRMKSPAKRVTTITSSATPTVNANTTDMFVITEQTQTAVFGAPTGSPTEGQTLLYRIRDNGTTRDLDWSNPAFRQGVDITFPSATMDGKWWYVGVMYNSTDGVWDLISAVNGF